MQFFPKSFKAFILLRTQARKSSDQFICVCTQLGKNMKNLSGLSLNVHARARKSTKRPSETSFNSKQAALLSHLDSKDDYTTPDSDQTVALT